jgi:chromosome segregation ATPase
VLAEVAEAERTIDEANRSLIFDPKELEKSEERLFALRAAARKYRSTVDTLAEVRERFERELAAITNGGTKLAVLEKEWQAAKATYDQAAERLSDKRRKAARALDKAVLAELPPLKLERARFETRIDTDAGKPGPTGIDRVEFMVAANPGTPLSPIMKVAALTICKLVMTVQANRLQNALKTLLEAIEGVNAAVEEMRSEHDPLASHIFVSRRQYRNMTETKSSHVATIRSENREEDQHQRPRDHRVWTKAGAGGAGCDGADDRQRRHVTEIGRHPPWVLIQ